MRPPDAFPQAAARSARAGGRRSAPPQRRGPAERFATRSTARLLQGAVAVLVFLARPARTHLVASDLGHLSHERYRRRTRARPANRTVRGRTWRTCARKAAVIAGAGSRLNGRYRLGVLQLQSPGK